MSKRLVPMVGEERGWDHINLTSLIFISTCIYSYYIITKHHFTHTHTTHWDIKKLAFNVPPFHRCTFHVHVCIISIRLWHYNRHSRRTKLKKENWRSHCIVTLIIDTLEERCKEKLKVWSHCIVTLIIDTLEERWRNKSLHCICEIICWMTLLKKNEMQTNTNSLYNWRWSHCIVIPNTDYRHSYGTNWTEAS